MLPTLMILSLPLAAIPGANAATRKDAARTFPFDDAKPPTPPVTGLRPLQSPVVAFSVPSWPDESAPVGPAAAKPTRAGGQGDLAVRLDAPVRAVERSLFAAHRTYQQGLLYPPSTTTRS